MESLPRAFLGMSAYRQFILYQLVPSKLRPGKMDKLPIDHRTGRTASAHDPAIWLLADEAVAISRRDHFGVGFVFTVHDPFFFIDIDNCLQADNTWTPTALEIMTLFNGCAMEVSSSGRGIHIFGRTEPIEHKCRNDQLNIEFYTSGRFVALTGTNSVGDVSCYNPGPVPIFMQKYGFEQTERSNGTHWTDQPVEEWCGTSNDDELISRMLRSKSTVALFGGGTSFRDLWECNVEMLERSYPSDQGSYDDSRADAALAQHLAFWTGNNCERMRALMLRSALAREKWERADYLPRTILGACGRQSTWLRDQQPDTSNVAVNSQPKATRFNGAGFVDVDRQESMFAGCTYVTDEHRILIPGGYTLSPERFRIVYGGFSFVMGSDNVKTTRNAWEVFTESSALRHPRADSSTFRPQDEPGSIITKDGQTLANIYWPVETGRLMGDASPFLRHLALVLPDERDQQILLAYLAAIVQHKGVKFQWTPLIQGVEGNGKTLFTRCVAYAIGDRYSHFPKAAEIAGKFNDWLFGKIFIGVEDIYVHDSQREVMEILKPMVTSERQEIEPKGGAKVTRDICANFLINTNHRDGLKKTRNDRRFAPFYCRQQSLADLKNSKMLGDYFPRLYTWLRTGGYAIVSELLHTYPIPPEYNPALIDRAPITSSTEQAIVQGQGGIEQAVEEAIAQGLVGFRRGWVSSVWLDRLLERLRAQSKMPNNRRKQLMEDLGYHYHPALIDGRTTRNVQPDGVRPRLYVQKDHIHANITNGGDICKQYTRDQQDDSE